VSKLRKSSCVVEDGQGEPVKPVQVRFRELSDQQALERVRLRDGDRDWTDTVVRLVHEADRGACRVDRGGRVCGAPIGFGDAACVGCIFDRVPKGRKVAK
jgi:sRNA-binding protein